MIRLDMTSPREDHVSLVATGDKILRRGGFDDATSAEKAA
jgi:hypothetical protein